MEVLNFLKSERKRREEIVSRLLSKNHITASEATVLLNSVNRINIQRVEMSSGARILAGDDNTAHNNYR